MKKRLAKINLGIFIFFLILGLVSAVFFPFFKGISKKIRSTASYYCTVFEEKTNLLISYKNLSPSIFNGLRIRNIILTDVQDGNSIIEIKKIDIHYNLLSLIFERKLSAIKNITIDGFSFEFDKNADSSVFEKIKQLYSVLLESDKSNSKNNSKVKALTATASYGVEEFEKLSAVLPFDVFLKNVYLKYRFDEKLFILQIKKVNLAFLTRSRQIMVNASCAFKYYNSEGAKPLEVEFSAGGSVPEKFNGTSVSLKVSSLSSGSLSFGRLNLHLGYQNGSFDLRTVQNAYPVFLKAVYDLKSSQAAVELKTDDLKLASLFMFQKENKKFGKVRLNLSADASYNFSSKLADFNSSGNVIVPKEVFDGGFLLDYALSGNSNEVKVEKLSVLGQKIDASFSGGYLYKDMNFSGELLLSKFMLPSGTNVATEIFFEPLEKGFMAFAPQLLLGEKSLTGLQLSLEPSQDSIDFDFELSDYSHYESDSPGIIKLNGSYINGIKYVQANLSASSIYLDSVSETVSSVAGKKTNFSFLKDFLFNGELFFSTNFNSLSFSIPYAFVADTTKNDRFLYLSLDGNDSSIQVSRLDLISGKNFSSFSALYEKSPDNDGAFVSADLNSGSIPYHFAGNIRDGNLSLSGDYGFSFDLYKSLGRIDGSLCMESFPVSISGALFTVAADTGFSYTKTDGINVSIARIEASEVGEKIIFHPSIELSGSASKYGFFLNKITYKDTTSVLEGKSELLWNINNGSFDSASLSFDAKNSSNSEKVSISADVSSVKDALGSSYYLNANMNLNQFSLNRFSSEQSDNNTVTATMIASGALDNPYIGINIDSMNLMAAGNLIKAKGSAFVEDKNLTLSSLNLTYNNIDVSKLKANFDLRTFTGTASAVLETSVMKKNVVMPLLFVISDTVIPEDKKVPEEYVATLSCDKVEGTFFAKTFPFSITILHSKGDTSFFSSAEQGISGTVSQDGTVFASVAEGKPVQFNITGNIEGSNFNLSFSKFSADLGVLFSYVKIPYLEIYEGLLKGSLKISGLKSDPDFTGAFSLSNADFSLPGIVPSHITVPKAIMTMNHNELSMQTASGMVKKSHPVFADLYILFDRWNLARLSSHIFMPKNSYAPGDVNVRFARFTGDACIDLNLLLEDGVFDITGEIDVRKLDSRIITKEIGAASNAVESNFPIRTSLKINVGQHVSFRLDPLLRAVFVPNSEFSFKYDSSDKDFRMDGEIALRSGDISYLNRSFYLKRGVLKFNGNDPLFNPLITVQAETRERDDDGNEIRITLSAENQRLQDFNPVFSSVPAKSEAEIRTMLGQIALGDSENVTSFLMATSDYAIQSLFGRNIENKLRDFLNFDILSVRTNILQNAVKQTFSNNSSDSSEKTFGIGNYFDNSTVYIGKYFGSDLYADALMHWTYDETRVDDKYTFGGLLFKPEFGFELNSPYVNIRWNMAPDIDAIMNGRFLTSTSVTLSWKISL